MYDNSGITDILFATYNRNIQALADMLDSRKGKDVAWGNRLGFILLPLHITSYNDPLEYIRKAKKMADRKKFSLEVLFTHAVVEITTKVLGAKVYIRQM